MANECQRGYQYWRSGGHEWHGVYGSNTPNNSVYAFSAATGTMVWRYTTGARIPNATPAVAKGLVYLGGDDGILYALNASTGALVWKYTTGNSIVSSPAYLTA